jgi:hypothetical protein
MSAELLAEDAVLLAQEVDDLELAEVDPARHPENQESHSLGTHRSDRVARLVIHLSVRLEWQAAEMPRVPAGRLSAHDAVIYRARNVLGWSL